MPPDHPSTNRSGFIGHETAARGESFWRFSLALYARPGVAKALIALQDRAGKDVNLLLFGLWLGVCRGRSLSSAESAAAAAAVAPIGEQVVTPLRRLRRRLKGAADADLQQLRPKILALELAAERQAQYRLAASPTLGPLAADRLAAAQANLALLLGDEVDSADAGALRRALAALTRSGRRAKVAALR